MSKYPAPAPTETKFVKGSEVARTVQSNFDKRPERWLAGSPFDSIDIRPGRVVAIGAPPGAGKTTLALQLMTGILGLQPNLQCVVGNIETGPETLVEKMLARLAGVPLDGIMERQMLGDERARVDAAIESNMDTFERVLFMQPPFDVPHMRRVMVAANARLAIVDYAQRFVADDGRDTRSQLDKVMSQVRTLANMGTGIILISSVSRQKSSGGSSSYKSLSMASLRGSAELEFGADSIYILKNEPERVTLECCKQRFGEKRDIPLRFNGPLQRFDLGDPLDAFDAAAGVKKGAK